MAINHGISKRLLQLVTLSLLVLFCVFRYGLDSVQAARVSDIRGTKHNLSAATDGSVYVNPTVADGKVVPARTVKATSETQICVFCHTPHGGSSSTKPLWNRKVAGAGYTQNYVLYDSSTLDAKQVQGSLMQPGGSSKLCLSCHDGTVAIGNVNVLNGLDKTGQAKTVSTIDTGAVSTMPGGSGTDTGFTRNLGVDLTNDHPISVSYSDTLADHDGELRKPSLNTTLIGVRAQSYKPKLPLQNTGGGDLYDPDGVGPLTSYSINAQVQCTTCHDPHIRETDTTVGNQKFLRLNRFQELNPPSSSGVVTTDNAGDIICMACHDKGGASWAFSAHANPTVANELYSNTHATRREFPTNLPVWKASCLNCHDTHAVAGTRRLLREGTNETTSTAAAPKAGGAGTHAIEETCYQCHDGGTNGTLQSYTEVPNIKSDFTTKSIRMPITNSAQGTSGGGGGTGVEVHDISGYFSGDSAFVDCTTKGTQCGKDFVEPRAKLGVGNLKNRHAECTDCHNPHRVIRGKRGLPGALNSTNTTEGMVNGASGGAHQHTETAITHTNVISGVLRGAWGIEPSYGSASFFALPSGYVVKRGDPASASVADCHGANKTNCDTATYVTREYQICLKCHSDYGYTDNNQHPSDSANGRPSLGGTNLTAKDVSRTANSYTTYTNQAREFQPPFGHRGEPKTTTDSGAGASFSTNNHRSWHPVMDNTGRSGSDRGNGTDISSRWRAPWNNAVGTQTMYCTDCHGSDTAAAGVIPDTGKPWGPHGSANNFLLKAPWRTITGTNNTGDLCFRCHNSANYTGGTEARTGFWIGRGSRGTGKDGHTTHRDKISGNIMRCNWCHVAVPHGWKNKSLLVNLNDAGPEVNLAAGTQIANGSLPYSNGPYYRNAMLKVDTFAASGNWSIGDCGQPGTSDDTARSWMQGTCGNPP